MRSSLTLLLLVALLAGCSARRSTKQIIPRIGHHETGIASWYGDPYHGRHAANGEVYDMEKLTAAHRTYAFDTWLRVVNLSNDKSVVVRITDRGPFVDHRIIDLSRAAARDIDMLRAGTTKVRLEVIPAPKGREYEAIHNKTNAKDVETARAAKEAKAAKDSAEADAEAKATSKTASKPADNGTSNTTSSITPDNTPTSIHNPTDDQRAPQVFSPSGRFTLQAGAFRTEANAQALAERLRLLVSGVNVLLDEKTSMWKVTVGSFENALESGELASRLRIEGVDTFVVEWVR